MQAGSFPSCLRAKISSGHREPVVSGTYIDILGDGEAEWGLFFHDDVSKLVVKPGAESLSGSSRVHLE